VKALVFGLLWVSVGVVVAARVGASRGERVLVLLFWPFFLVGGEEPEPELRRGRGPLSRLRQALGGEDAAEAVVGELERAVERLERRLSRVDAAHAELDAAVGPGGDSDLARARRRSMTMLEEARERCRQELDAALAAVEETATRLVVAQETGSSVEVRGLLESLRSRLRAAEEVAGVATPAGEPLGGSADLPGSSVHPSGRGARHHW